jgi:hypothetical protein
MTQVTLSYLETKDYCQTFENANKSTKFWAKMGIHKIDPWTTKPPMTGSWSARTPEAA